VHTNGGGAAAPSRPGNGGPNKEPLTPPLLDSLFAAGLQTPALGAHLAPAPGAVTVPLSGWEEQALLPNAERMVSTGLVRRGGLGKGTAGWVETRLDDALLNQLASDGIR